MNTIVSSPVSPVSAGAILNRARAQEQQDVQGTRSSIRDGGLSSGQITDVREKARVARQTSQADVSRLRQAVGNGASLSRIQSGVAAAASVQGPRAQAALNGLSGVDADADTDGVAAVASVLRRGSAVDLSV
jgi:hypothetical protein